MLLKQIFNKSLKESKLELAIDKNQLEETLRQKRKIKEKHFILYEAFLNDIQVILTYVTFNDKIRLDCCLYTSDLDDLERIGWETSFVDFKFKNVLRESISLFTKIKEDYRF